MSDIDTRDIRRLDVAVLLVFQELLRQRKTTQVALRLGLSQSAVSHALGRLRDVFRDPLFTRRPDGLDPTPRALELAPQIEAVIDMLGQAVRSSVVFEPATSRRLFRMAANDLVGALLAAPLLRDLRKRAPESRLTLHFVVGDESLDALRRNVIDLAVGRIYELPAGFVAKPLFEESFVVVAREKHPAVKRGLTLRNYLSLEHILVSFKGNLSGMVDLALKRQGLERRVTASVPMFLTAFAAVAESDVIATVPARLAQKYARSFGLRVLATPMPVDPFLITIVRHSRNIGDQGLDWFVERIEHLVGGDGTLSSARMNPVTPEM